LEALRNLCFGDTDDIPDVVIIAIAIGEKIVDHEIGLRNRMTGRLLYQPDAAAGTRMVTNARMCRAYIIDRLFQLRVAAMKELKEAPAPGGEEREPWLD
jgi:hypothetical protein